VIQKAAEVAGEGILETPQYVRNYENLDGSAYAA
jgi:hypothetical protein